MKTLTLALSALLFSSATLAEESHYWWQPHQNNPGFTQALEQFSLTPDALNAKPERFLALSENPAEPLYWLRHSLEIYQHKANNRYAVPVVETSTMVSKRLASWGRQHFFLSETFVQPGDMVRIKTGEITSSTMDCHVSTGINLFEADHHVNQIRLTSNGITDYQASDAGALMFTCIDRTNHLEHYGKKIPVEVISGGQHAPLFVFGLNSRQEWSETILKQPNPNGQVSMFNGRARFAIPNSRLGNAARLDIMLHMRQHLQIVNTYDRVNGQDMSNPAHYPALSLFNVNYNNCCYASSANGMVAVGSYGAPWSPSWLDWHEYAHHYDIGWSWDQMIEVSLNLYSAAGCRIQKGEQHFSQCHSSKILTELDWDAESVGRYLASGQQNYLSQTTGGRERFFIQLFSSYPDLFPALGKQFRLEYNRGNHGGKFSNDQQKKDWFAINVSKITGQDLRQFFDRWDLTYSAEAGNAIAAMKLPQPVQSPQVFTYQLTSNGDFARVRDAFNDPALDNRNSGLMAYGAETGPVKQIWSGNGHTEFTVQVWDEQQRPQQIILRGYRGQGNCASGIIHSGWHCPSGTHNHWWVDYVPADNADLPAGRYTGMLQLKSRDWYKPEWAGQMKIALDITHK